MGDIFRQLGHLFLQAIPTVIFVFVLFVVLDRLFFRPLIAVLKKRADATLGALARAREQATAAESKTKEYEERFQAARQDVYRQREAALQKARQQTEVMVQEAQARLAKEVAGVRAELESACRPLAEMISQSLVGPESTTGGGGGARL